MTLNLTADPERVKHLLITARDELKARGWTQGDYGTIDGPKCTFGALAWAHHGDVLPRVTAIDDMVELDAGYVLGQVVVGWSVVDWNDMTGRTSEQVIAGFDAAIGLVDAEIARRQSVAQVQGIAHLAGIETEVTR